MIDIDNRQRSLRLGKNIRLARRKHDLKQKELAEAVQISTNYLCSIEQGKSTPSLGVVTKIADHLNVSISSLLEDNPVLDDIRDLVNKYDLKEIVESINEITKYEKQKS